MIRHQSVFGVSNPWKVNESKSQLRLVQPSCLGLASASLLLCAIRIEISRNWCKLSTSWVNWVNALSISRHKPPKCELMFRMDSLMWLGGDSPVKYLWDTGGDFPCEILMGHRWWFPLWNTYGTQVVISPVKYLLDQWFPCEILIGPVIPLWNTYGNKGDSPVKYLDE